LCQLEHQPPERQTLPFVDRQASVSTPRTTAHRLVAELAIEFGDEVITRTAIRRAIALPPTGPSGPAEPEACFRVTPRVPTTVADPDRRDRISRSTQTIAFMVAMSLSDACFATQESVRVADIG